MNSVTVDFVARSEDPNNWNLVLVEQGPWPKDQVDVQLRRVQGRLYDCIDAAVDGQVAAKFPESFGKSITIRLDGYDLPENEVRTFFNAFAAQVLALPDYSAALAASAHVTGITFEVKLRRLRP
jgi:hypothetical protein